MHLKWVFWHVSVSYNICCSLSQVTFGSSPLSMWSSPATSSQFMSIQGLALYLKIHCQLNMSNFRHTGSSFPVMGPSSSLTAPVLPAVHLLKDLAWQSRMLPSAWVLWVFLCSTRHGPLLKFYPGKNSLQLCRILWAKLQLWLLTLTTEAINIPPHLPMQNVFFYHRGSVWCLVS